MVPLKEALEDRGRPCPELRDLHASPEESVMRLEQGEQIQRMLNQLPKQQRVALILRDIEGLSYDEIAEAMGISLGTVKSRIARGREQMRLGLAGMI